MSATHQSPFLSTFIGSFQILPITVSMADVPNFSCLWLQVVSHRIGLSQELLGYFGLFLIRFCKEGKQSGKERRNAGQPGAGEGWCGWVPSPQDAGDTAQ